MFVSDDADNKHIQWTPPDKSLWRVRKCINHGPCPEKLRLEWEKYKDILEQSLELRVCVCV